MKNNVIIPGVLAAIAAIYYIKKIKINNIASKLPRSYQWPERSLSEIDDITIHHSASGPETSAYDFARWHISEKGWPGIGYHFVIDPNGTINQTNPLSSYSYHNGYDNKGAVGVCLVGNFNNYPPTPEQQKSLIKLIRYLKGRLNIKTLTGHKEYPNSSTACPGLNLNTEYFRIKSGLPKYGATAKQKINSFARSGAGKNYSPATADN